MSQEYHEKYAYLDQLSTQQLEELLLADAEDPSGRDTSEAVFHILEVLRKREETPIEVPDPDQAWERFQRYYNTPENRDLVLYPCEEDLPGKVIPTPKKSSVRFSALWKTLRVAAATVALLFALMIGVQASGVNVFGALAQWTSETFHFGAETQSENYQLFIDMLIENDIQKDLAPTWIPNGFQASEPQVLKDNLGISIQLSYSNPNGDFFTIAIQRYNEAKDFHQLTFEKDPQSGEIYEANTKSFYIFNNFDSVTAGWSNDFLEETIWGSISIDDVKHIIDSIGG